MNYFNSSRGHQKIVHNDGVGEDFLQIRKMRGYMVRQKSLGGHIAPDDPQRPPTAMGAVGGRLGSSRAIAGTIWPE